MAYNKTNWENLPSTNTPVSASNLNKIENGIYDNSLKADQVGDLTQLTTTEKSTLVGAINETNTEIGNITGTILWTNSSPTSAFSSQTITLSSNDFDIYEVFYYISTENIQVLTSKSIKGHGTRLMIPSTNMEYRTMTSNSDTSYTFNVPSNSSFAVPIYVIGYKTGLFE